LKSASEKNPLYLLSSQWVLKIGEINSCSDWNDIYFGQIDLTNFKPNGTAYEKKKISKVDLNHLRLLFWTVSFGIKKTMV
jgi:hypothetical protein